MYYMNENTISNFGLLKRFNIEDKRQLAENILGRVGSLAGARIGNASTKSGKAEGSVIGAYIGSRIANDSAATVRAIKQVTQNPQYQTLNVKQKLNKMKAQAVENANNYRLNSIDNSLNTLKEIDTKTVPKTIRQAALEKLPDVIKKLPEDLFTYNKKKITNFKHKI